MNTWSGIYKRDFLKKNNIRHNETPGASFQDNGFFFQTFCLAERVWFLDKPFYMNRRDNINSSVHAKDKVYAFTKEYKFIKDFLIINKLYDTFNSVYWLKKFHNYMFNLERISEEYKIEFLEFFADEFGDAVERKEIDLKEFSEIEKNILINIIYGF